MVLSRVVLPQIPLSRGWLTQPTVEAGLGPGPGQARAAHSWLLPLLPTKLAVMPRLVDIPASIRLGGTC